MFANTSAPRKDISCSGVSDKLNFFASYPLSPAFLSSSGEYHTALLPAAPVTGNTPILCGDISHGGCHTALLPAASVPSNTPILCGDISRGSLFDNRLHFFASCPLLPAFSSTSSGCRAALLPAASVAGSMPVLREDISCSSLSDKLHFSALCPLSLAAAAPDNHGAVLSRR
eukprot:2868313-Pleurochrysis_carterae.AAC.1